MLKQKLFGSTYFSLGFLLLLLVLCLTSESLADDKSQKPKIYTVNYPLEYFAERIGGDSVQVFFPAPPGVDPAYWSPSRDVIRQYQGADLILLNGADYAKWVSKVTLPKSKLLDTSRSFKSEYIQIKDAITHSHGPGGEHEHKGVAFTTWLDPSLAAKQAESIKEALIKLSPGQKDYFQKNYESLKSDLEKLDQEIKAIVVTDPDKPLLASHPVYQYIARRYSLNLKSLHWEPDQALGSDNRRDLEIILEEHPSKLMIWEGEPVVETRIYLSGIGIDSIVFDPCGNIPEKGDYLDVMKKNASNLKSAYK